MNHQSFNRLSINLRFCNRKELENAMEGLIQFIVEYPSTIQEIEFKIFWKKSQLTSKHGRVMKSLIDRLRKVVGDSKIIYNTPYCFDEPKKASSFPNCERCQFLTDGSCHWPKQMTHSSSRKFDAKNLENNIISPRDFEGANPLTWFYPERSDFVLLNSLFNSVDEVVDFNCDYGFASELLLREEGSFQVCGIEPRKTPIVEDLRFTSYSTPKVPKKSWALLSTAEFNTSVLESLIGVQPPEIIALIHRQSSSDFGGENIFLNLRNGELNLSHCQSIFDPSFLNSKTYNKVFSKQVKAWDSTNPGKFEVYCLPNKQTLVTDTIELHQWKSCKGYAWEENPTTQFRIEPEQKYVSL